MGKSLRATIYGMLTMYQVLCEALHTYLETSQELSKVKEIPIKSEENEAKGGKVIYPSNTVSRHGDSKPDI